MLDHQSVAETVSVSRQAYKRRMREMLEEDDELGSSSKVARVDSNS